MAASTGRRMICFQLLILFSFYNSVIYSHNVPVFIWGSESHTSCPALSSLSHVSSTEFSKEYMKQILSCKVPVICFIQDRLSLEDLSLHENGLEPKGPNFKHLQSNLDQQYSLILPSVEDPFQVLREVKGHQSIETLSYNDDMHRKLSGTRGDLILVYLPQTVGIDNRLEALKANDELMSKAVKNFGHSNYIAIFTGKEPSWDAASEEASHQRIARHLLQSQSAEEPSNKTHFFAYATQVELKITDPTGQVNVTNATLPWPPLTQTLISAVNSSIIFRWDFGDATEEVEKVFMILQFNMNPIYWDINFSNTSESQIGFTIKPDLARTLTLTKNRDNPLSASKGFSYSCETTRFSATGDNITATLKFKSFQIELYPIGQDNATYTFKDSFHCSTWFTIPVWMGFITVLLFTAILGFGIFMLFEVKTMDRFDDPKGKTITVPLAE